MDKKTTQNPQESVMSFNEKVAQLTPLADAGDRQALLELAELYIQEVGNGNADKTVAEKCYQYVRQAVDMDIPIAYLYLSSLYDAGIGVHKEPVEAYHYAKRFFEEYDEQASDEERSMARYILGNSYVNGSGVQRDVPYGYALICESVQLSPNDDNTNAKQYLEEKYPFDSDGEIDLSVHGRSNWLTFFIIIAILGSVWGFALPQIEKDAGRIFGGLFYVGMGVNLVIYLGLLFWQRWSGWAVLAQWPIAVIGGTSALVSWAGSGNLMEISALQQLGMSQMAAPYVTTFIIILLQRRKNGRALPWCTVTNTRDDGRNMFTRFKDIVMEYGEGEEYRVDSSQSKVFINFCYAATALVVAMGLFTAYQYITSDKSWGMDIEWKCWNSPGLWGFLSFIGFFAQFFDWQHFSYVTYNVWKDENGRVKKVERNRDILTEMEGGILMPLLMHLIVVPAMYGAFFYYIIMGVIALLGALIPYFVAVLAVALSWPFYRVCTHFFPRRWRVLLLISWTVIALLFLLIVAAGAHSKSHEIKSEEIHETTAPQPIGHATVTANIANLRTGPGTEYDYYTLSNGAKMQATQGDDVQILEDVGEWFKILTSEGGVAYIKKSLCSDMEYYQLSTNEPEEEVAFTEEDDEGEETEKDISGGELVIYQSTNQFYCDGVYESDSGEATQDFSTDLEGLNRHHFSLSFDYWPEKDGDVLVLSRGWRILSVYLKDDNTVSIKTDNGDHVYTTNCSYELNGWNHIDVEYNNGTLTVNGQKQQAQLNTEDGDNKLTSKNYSYGGAFQGKLKNIVVKTFNPAE